ncbi:MAG: hypothetical protein PHI18_01205 [bacterium]|nr:hypothetical protein [bacterium]
MAYRLPTYYFISDPEGGLWHGIQVNDAQDRGLSIGDSIRFEAEVRETSSETRLRISVTGAFSTGTPVAPAAPHLIASGEVGESAEGVLIELTDATVVSVGSGQFTVDDGSGPLTVGSGWTYAHEPLVGEVLRYLRGIVTASGSVYTLNPRGDGDFGFVGNRPPLFSEIANTPERPNELQSDTVTVVLTDDEGVGSAVLYYRFGLEGDFTARPMYDDGQHHDGAAGDGRWGGVIPAGPARTTCYYYLWAEDTEGASATSPAAAPASTHAYLILSSIRAIYDIQYTGNPTGGNSPFADSLVTVTGIVTGAAFGNGSDFYMSDPVSLAPEGGRWSGIFVYGGSIDPALGDCVSVTGQVVEYSGLTEYTGGNVVTLLGQQAVVPEPIDVRVGELADSSEAYEGCLIRVGTCWVTSITDWPTQYPAFRIANETGSAYVVKDISFEYVPAVGDTFTSITGCVSYYSGHGWELAPRSDDDIRYIDHRAPQLTSATAVSDTAFNVLFNERLDTVGISDLANYHLVDQTDLLELHVLTAYLYRDGRTIQLTTLERLLPGHAYQLTVGDVQDVSGNVLTGAVVSFAGYEPEEYVQIADIYRDFDAYNGRSVTLRGVVTFVQDVTTTSGSRRISAYLQDNSGLGFYLSQTGAAASFPGIQRGNLITITGIASSYAGAVQLQSFNGTPNTDIFVLGENQPLPEPIRLATGDRTTQQSLIVTSSSGNYGSGTWVQVTGTIYQVDENVGGGTNIMIDDGSGNVTIRVWDDMGLTTVVLGDRTYRKGDLVGVLCSVAGVTSAYDGDFQMLGGYAEDFTLPDQPVPSDELRLDVPNRPFAPDLGQKLHIVYSSPTLGAVRLRVFNLRGHLVTTLLDKNAGGPNELWWDGRDELRNILPLGTYILHLESVQDGTSDTIVKPVVIGTKL